jgi:hypothetical protein
MKCFSTPEEPPFDGEFSRLRILRELTLLALNH